MAMVSMTADGSHDPSVHQYLYMAGIVHRARRDMLEQMGRSQRAHAEVEDMLQHCTFTPCLDGTMGQKVKTPRRRRITATPPPAAVTNETRQSLLTCNTSTTGPHLMRCEPAQQLAADGNEGDVAAASAADWGSPGAQRPSTAYRHVDPLTDRPLVAEPSSGAGIAASQRLYDDLFRRQKVAVGLQERKRILEDAHVRAVTQPARYGANNEHEHRQHRGSSGGSVDSHGQEHHQRHHSALVDSPQRGPSVNATASRRHHHEKNTSMPHFMKPLPRNAAPPPPPPRRLLGPPPVTRPVDSAAWQAREQALLHARPTTAELEAMAARAKQRAALREAEKAATQKVAELSEKKNKDSAAAASKRGRSRSRSADAYRRGADGAQHQTAPRTAAPAPAALVPKLTIYELL